MNTTKVAGKRIIFIFLCISEASDFCDLLSLGVLVFVLLYTVILITARLPYFLSISLCPASMLDFPDFVTHSFCFACVSVPLSSRLLPVAYICATPPQKYPSPDYKSHQPLLSLSPVQLQSLWSDWWFSRWQIAGMGLRERGEWRVSKVK